MLSVTCTGDPVAVVNTTKGEIASLTAPNIGTLQTVGNLGFATPEATPAAVMPRAVIAHGNDYPFVQQHTGVTIGTGITTVVGTDPVSGKTGDIFNVGGTGDAVSILVGGGVGNLNIGGILQTLVANSGGVSPPGQVDGIDGPILATSIYNVNIGAGIAFNGTGLVGFAGLFATDVIGAVSNLGNTGSNVRGVIIAGGETSAAEISAVTQAINEVDLVNGSLIDAKVLDLAGAAFIEASDVSPYDQGLNQETQNTDAANYVYGIGTVAVSGSAGIIGTEIGAGDVGTVVVAGGGFGILNSQIVSVGDGRVESVSASGYGIRNTSIGGGGFVGSVTATGTGGLIPTSAYPLAVRASDNGDQTIDPTFGMYPSPRTDLNAVLGLSSSTAAVSDVTDTGVVEDDDIVGLVSLGSLTAHTVRTALPLTAVPTVEGEPLPPNIPVVGTPFNNTIDFGGNVGLIRVYTSIDGLQVTAGQIVKLNVNGDVTRLGLSVNGPIDSLIVHGNLGQIVSDPVTGGTEADSYIDTTGPSGRLLSATINGNLYANVDVFGRIGTLTVLGNVDGTITVQGNVTGTNPANVAAYSVNTLHVGGGIADGALNITGSVNNFIVNAGLGVAGGTLTIGGGINHLSIGNNHKAGAKLAGALTVGGTVRQLTVYGEITGSVHVVGDLLALNVTNDRSTPDAIAGPITVGGNLTTATVTNGGIAADVTVNGGLRSLTVSRGSIAAGATVSSTLSSIGSVRVIGGAAYGIDGSILAPAGTGLNVFTTGSLGDGTDPATISALSAGAIAIGGNVNPKAAISIIATVNSLRVGGAIQAGATVAGHPIRSHSVGGAVAGSLIVS